MGQILFRQPKKPLNKGFFMYSYMPPTAQQRFQILQKWPKKVSLPFMSVHFKLTTQSCRFCCKVLNLISNKVE